MNALIVYFSALSYSYSHRVVVSGNLLTTYIFTDINLIVSLLLTLSADIVISFYYINLKTREFSNVSQCGRLSLH